MRQKGFAPVYILAGVLIMVVVAGGAFYLGKTLQKPPQPRNPVVNYQASVAPSAASSTTVIATSLPTTPDETANWKTYTSTKYGYSIKYPADWKLSVTVLTENNVPETEVNNFPQRIDLRNITGDQNFSTISIDPEGYGSCINPSMKKSNVELNGLKTTSNFFINNIGHEVYCYTNFELKNLSKLSVEVSYPKNDVELVNQILSTFKFTQ